MKVSDPFVVVCNFSTRHAANAPIRFEVNWAPIPIGGTFTINQREILLSDASCFLFKGDLEVEFQAPDAAYYRLTIPFDDAIEFSELTGRAISIADYVNATSDNPISKPAFFVDHVYYSISSLSVDAIRYLRDLDVLSIAFDFEAHGEDSPVTIFVRSQLTCLCRPVERIDLLYLHGPIPVRFAKKYLPLLDLPEISEDATCTDVISLFGTPDHQGGGNHPVCGLVPKWIRYTFPSFYLHFQMERDAVTQVTIMSREGPLPASFPE